MFAFSWVIYCITCQMNCQNLRDVCILYIFFVNIGPIGLRLSDNRLLCNYKRSHIKFCRRPMWVNRPYNRYYSFECRFFRFRRSINFLVVFQVFSILYSIIKENSKKLMLYYRFQIATAFWKSRDHSAVYQWPLSRFVVISTFDSRHRNRTAKLDLLRGFYIASLNLQWPHVHTEWAECRAATWRMGRLLYKLCMMRHCIPWSQYKSVKIDR